MADTAMTTDAGATQDEYSTPIPQGAYTSAPAGSSPDEYSTPIPEGASTQAPLSPSEQTAKNGPVDVYDFSMGGQLKQLKAVGAGVGEGLLSTVNGALDAVNKFTGLNIPHDTLQAGEQKLKDLNTNNPGLRKIGYGGETIAELLLGDEFLKGLAMSDRLLAIAKTMKVFEKSPRLIAALKIGAEALATGGRTGVVQGAQTLARTGGDTDQAVKEGLIGGAVGTALGGATSTLTHYLGKGAEAAGTIDDMNAVANGKSAPVPDGTGAPRGTGGHASGEAPTSADVNRKFAKTTNDAFAADRDAAQDELDEAKSKLAELGDKPASNEQITETAQTMAKAGYKSLGDAYRDGMADLDEWLGDETIAYKDSPLHKAAKSLLNEGDEAKGPLDEALRKTRPGSSQANKMLEMLADPSGGEEDAAKAGQPDKWVDADGKEHVEEPAAAEPQEPIELNIEKLGEYRRLLGERMRNLGWSDSNDLADRHVYKELIQGVDDTIEELAKASGNPQAVDRLAQMNADYKAGIRLFDNADVKSMLKGNVNDVSKKLMSGSTSVDDIDAVRKALGPANFQKIQQDTLTRMVANHAGEDGSIDYQKLFKSWGRLNPDVREAMFGGKQAEALTSALKQATGASDTLDAINQSVADLLGNGDVSSLMKDPARVQALAERVGPAGMKSLGKATLENQIAEAASTLDPKTGEIVKTKFNPDKVLNWWVSMKDSPEVRNALFTVDKGAATEYNNLMKRLAQASSVKKLVKYGILPITLGTAGVIHGPGAALIAALAGSGIEAGFGAARDILDTIANNPRTWKVMQGAYKVATSGAGRKVASGMRAVTSSTLSAPNNDPTQSRARSIYAGAADSLGGTSPQRNP